MPTYRLTVAYDGSPFFGWQRHPGQPTVQGTLEDALLQTTGVRAPIEGSGRTDRGAHADAQVASVTVPEGTDLSQLNTALPESIRVLEVEPTHEGFHARMEAKGKTYRYVIWNAPECPPELVGKVWHIPGKLDAKAMGPACRFFVGQIDFASFAKKTNFQRHSTMRRMHQVDLATDGPKITITLRADSFLYQMVRNIVRTIVRVGEGRLQADQIPAILAARDRAKAPGSAPASGLHLERVHY